VTTLAEVRLWGRRIGAVALEDRAGVWSLSPAFDITWSHNPAGAWTHRHQMSMNGKREGFTRDDFLARAKTASLNRARAVAILKDVQAAVEEWPRFAEAAGVGEDWRRAIDPTLRLEVLISASPGESGT
jgi:serine/threonine-protein kinase HipA